MPKTLGSSVKVRGAGGKKKWSGAYLAAACAVSALISACVGVVENGSGAEGLDSTAGAGATGMNSSGAPATAGTPNNTAGDLNSAGGQTNGAGGNPVNLGGSFGSGGGNTGGPGGNGLSCEVNRVLTTCLTCHGVTPGLTLLGSRDALLADSTEQPGKRVIDVALSRMRDTALPMPPKPLPAASASDIAVLSAWVSNRTPDQSCGTSGNGGSGAGGSSFGGSSNAGSGQGGSGQGGSGQGGSGQGQGGSAQAGRGGMGAAGASTAVVCTSKSTWTSGNGANMRPGAACPSCHNFAIAGTIYPTAHEPLNCNGVNGNTGVKVVITGSNGTKVTLTPGATGNFYTSTRISTPYTVQVINGATTRSMLTPQTSGNCNSCHTQNGANGAPGRIMTP